MSSHVDLTDIPTVSANPHLGDNPIQLSILVPTFQRAFLLKNVLHHLVAAIEFAGVSSDQVEVLVSDNQSTDGTGDVCSEFTARYSYIRYYRQPVHYNSGEENIFTAMPECRGTYVWTFSDDDIPEIWSVKTILGYLHSREVNFILINPALISPEGKLLAERLIDCLPDELELPLWEMIARLGMINLSCCFSAVIYHREQFMKVDWRSYIDQSPIYSHVMMYCEAFSGRKGIFLNQPLLQYRIGGTEDDAWKTRSRVLRMPMRFPWSIGLIRLFWLVRTKGVVPQNFMHQVIERDLQGPFLLNEHVLWELTAQMQIWMNSDLDYEAVTAEHIREYMNEFAAGDQYYVEALYKLAKVQQVWEAVKATDNVEVTKLGQGTFADYVGALPAGTKAGLLGIVRRWADQMINEVRSLLAPRRVARPIEPYQNYNLFRVGTNYIGVEREVQGVDVARVDFEEYFPETIIRPSLIGLKDAIRGATSNAAVGVVDGGQYKGYGIKLVDDRYLAVKINYRRPLPQRFNPWKYYPDTLGHPDPNVLKAVIDSLEHHASLARLGISGLGKATGAAEKAVIERYFSEDWYVRQYPVVAAAIRNGAYANGMAHFLDQGIELGLDPSPYFHGPSALLMYPNVAAAIQKSEFKSWFDFYVRVGRANGFSPSVYFDEPFYRRLYADIDRAIELNSAFVCGFDHFLSYGSAEDRIPNAIFESAWYRARRPNVPGGSELPSYLHYLRFGQAVGVNPCSWFDGAEYLKLNASAAVEVQMGHYRSAFHHWISTGWRNGARLS